MTRPLFLIATLLATASCTAEHGLELPPVVAIPGGQFVMGAPAEADAQQGKPQHLVSVPAFQMSATPVTFAQYDAFARATGRPLPQDDGIGRGRHPVVNVDRADALAYVAWLNAGTAGGWRLPSEAEWEYAARAGTTTGFYWGDDPDQRMSNTRGTGLTDRFDLTSPAGYFPPNQWGLYDMAGNVWEMVADCLHPDYVGAPVDGSAWQEDDCQRFVARGGDYSSSRRGQRPSARAGAGAHFRSTSLGFRVVRDIR
jgi:formylglycine-generating enzyme required for sulfatase activity